MSWWVVQTESQREHLVISQLGRLGFSTYAPRIKHRSRIAWLFPTYVFVGKAEQFYPVLWCPRVVRLLMAGDRPSVLAEHVIAEFHSREKGGFVKLPTPRERIKKGDHVRISAGPFCGHIALYAGMSGHARVHVLLELLGRKEVSIELKDSDIVPLDVVAQ